jgi:hypothetical protein
MLQIKAKKVDGRVERRFTKLQQGSVKALVQKQQQVLPIERKRANLNLLSTKKREKTFTEAAKSTKVWNCGLV